ncbi:hypothetical protein [Bradyrhizobium sp. USDA 223]
MDAGILPAGLKAANDLKHLVDRLKNRASNFEAGHGLSLVMVTR